MSQSNDRTVSHGSSWRCAELENAALFASGALTHAERGPFAAHVETCADCKAELEQHAATVATLDLLQLQDDLAHDRGAKAPESVRAALVAALGAPSNRGTVGAAGSGREPTTEERAARATPEQPAPLDRKWQRWSGAPGETIAPGLVNVASSDAGWEAIGIPGIAVKQLAVDAEARKATMLIRMGPGTSYPRHRHAAREECFVLEGELFVGNARLRAGDFQVAERDSIHDVQSTDTGCVLLIVSSQDDELV